MNTIQYRKREQIEQEIGCTIEDYIKRAAATSKSQREMAEELGVQAITIGRWIEKAGYEKVFTYRKRRRAA